MVNDILAERQQSHGNFAHNAKFSQALKRLLDTGANRTDVQQEAVDMICLKLSRILSNPNVADHWDDIAGYATLAANELRETK
jgi:hypothetical protein